MERVEGEEEEEESILMELLDAELVYFGGDHHGFCKTSSDSSSSSTITCSKSSTAEKVTRDRTNKRQKRGASVSLGTIKVRKDKLGDRISALQQLVSPFGKSDTASVLHEALGYIQFLHEQVQVLSSPYLLQRMPTTANQQDESRSTDERRGGDLRSRGLCLVPISCTEEVAVAANDNGADLWSPAMETTNFYYSKHQEL